jgi:hypothetical protein
LEEEPTETETVYLASVPGNSPGVPHTPLTLILTENEDVVFPSLTDYPKVRLALLDMYDNMMLPENRFAYFFEKLHKEDPNGLLSSSAIQEQFSLTHTEDLRGKYFLMLLLGYICGENSLEFLYTIATTPLPTGLSIEDERLEWEELIRVAAARNIYRTYKFKKSALALDAMISILGSSSNLSNGVRLELISHLKFIEGWSNQNLSSIVNTDYLHLLNIEIMQGIPNEVITNDPVRVNPGNNDAPYMEGE